MTTFNVKNSSTVEEFGPRLDGSFDFNLLFEQSILSIIPSALLLLLSPIRIKRLFRRETHARGGWLLFAKLGSATVLFCLQLTLLVLWALPATTRTRVSLAAAVLAVLDSCVIGVLLYTEHKRSIRPSILLSLYLALSTVLDLAQARSLFIQGQTEAEFIAGVFTALLVTKITLLILEELPKRRFLSARYRDAASESTSGPISRSVFWWLNELFIRGFRGLLKVPDLGPIDSKFSSAVLLSKLGQAWDAVDKTVKHCLLHATVSAFKVTFLAPVIPRLIYAAFKFAQPFLVNRVIDFVGEPQDRDASSTAGGLIAATFLIYTGLALMSCLYDHLVYQLITTLRGGLVSLIFQKTMNLDIVAASEGAAVTLMSTDIEGIAWGVKEIHEIWANTLELGVAVYLLQRQIGAACFVVVIPGVVCSLLMERLTGGIGPARATWNRAVQKRVSVTSSMLGQIKGIKMMGLTDYFTQVIHDLRVGELDLSKKARKLTIRMMVISNLSNMMTPAAVVGAAVYWTRSNEEDFDVSRAFTALSIVALVSTPLASLIGSYPTFLGSLSCFGRIQTFLLSDEQKDQRSTLDISSRSANTSGHNSDGNYDPQQSSVESSGRALSDIEMVSLRQPPSNIWNSSKRVVLENANFAIKGEPEPVIRNISASFDKSSCTMIVGPVGSGKSSLLKAILGEIPLSDGAFGIDKTGTSVAYCDQTAWLRNISVRDNILGESEFDEEWYNSVVNACALKEDLARFAHGDRSLVGSGGITLSGGQKQRLALARALYARCDIVLLDDVFSALDSTTARLIFSRILGQQGLLRRNKTTVLLATHAVHHLPAADTIIVLSQTGSISQCGSFSELQNTNGYVKELALQASSGAANDDDTIEGVPVSQEAESKLTKGPDDGDLIKQTGDLSMYKFYLKSVPALYSLTFLLLGTGYIFSDRLPYIWLRIWTERGMANTDRGAYFGVYMVFSLSNVLFAALAFLWLMIVVIPRSAIHLHRMLLDAVLRAPLWWFTSTDSGVTLNRFSQDMTLVDQALPMAFLEATFDTLNVVAAAALIASGAQYVAAIIPVCMVPLYFLQKYYLRTSRQIRHLDLEAKSPLYTHFTETLNGVVTIRAFGWKQAFMAENLKRLDFSQKPYYLLFCIQRWLNVVVNLFVAGIAMVLVAFAVQFKHTTSRGAIGLALINMISFDTSLARLISAWTNLETSLGAASRLRWFVQNTPRENRPEESSEPEESWPSTGSIELDRLTASYKPDDDAILRDISLHVKPGQKVGICGRTGSGKSSLLLTILRLLETPSGSLRIDDLDLTTAVRNRIRLGTTALPQDPVKLPGTVRTNINPYNNINNEDNTVIDALRQLGIWDIISARGGLDAEFDTLGLSHGQQQLFCLARTLLHKSKVVLLDEATSSVDRQTDEQVQEVLRREFADSTVLAVAHRLETIAQADVVVVMDQGRIVEVGEPGRLREQKKSLFRELWESRQ